MPISSARLLIAAGVSVAEDRVAAEPARLPPVGMSVVEFERSFMMGVDPALVHPVIEAMHRKGVIWMSRNRGAVHVFPKRPNRVPRVMALDAGQMDAFLSVVTPHMRRAVMAEKEKASGSKGAAYALEVECGRIVGLVRKRASSGLLLADMRAELWALFPASVMKAVAFADPRLQRESTVDEFEDEIRTPKRIANGLPLDERLVALARKAGARGVTKTDLLNAIHPRVAAADIERALQRLGSEGRLQSVRVSGRGRPAVRWSVKEEGPPKRAGKG